MQYQKTNLERQLEGLSPEQRNSVLMDRWISFRQSEYFDLLAMILRDVELDALERLRHGDVQAVHRMVAVDAIRKAFESLDRSAVDWSDSVGPF